MTIIIKFKYPKINAFTMEKTLEKLGLSRNEAKVYLTLLELGLTSAKPIIEKTNLHRQLVYDALNLLIEKGLVSYVIQANRKYFKAANPKQFLDYFIKKKKRIQEEEQLFKKILPQLEAKRQRKSEEQEATIYRGNKGIKSLLDDMINERKEILTIGASDIKAEAFQYHLKFNLPKIHKIRVEKKIPIKILFSEELKERAKEMNKLRYTEARVLPKEFTSNSSTNIYGDKISIMLWGSQPFGILVKSKDIAEEQINHFNLLWKIGKKTFK